MDKVLSFLAKHFPSQDFTIVHSFKIMHHEWEGDGWGWIISDGKEHKVLMSTHGSIYVATENELALHIQELADVLSETLRARQLLSKT